MAEESHNPQKQAADILRKAFEPAPIPKPEEVEEPAVEVEAAPQELEEAPITSETLDTPAEPETPPEEAGDISTLNTLAETLDISIEDMYALNLKMPDGMEQVDLGKLKNFYLDNQNIEQARQEIESERSQLKAAQEKAQELPPVHQELIDAKANVMLVEREWQELQASGLKVTDPATYAAKAVDMQNRYQQATGELGRVDEVVQRNQQESLARQQQELHGLVPDLKDDAKREKIAARVESMFKTYNVDPNYIGLIADPNAMKMLIELSSLNEQKGTLKDKRVNTAPKVLKPQAVQQSQAGKQAALKRLTEKARNSKQTRDKVAAVSALIGG